VFTARYELSPYIKQIRFVFKGLTFLLRIFFLFIQSVKWFVCILPKSNKLVYSFLSRAQDYNIQPYVSYFYIKLDIISALSDFHGIRYRRSLQKGRRSVSFLQIGSVTVILHVWQPVKMKPYFTYFWLIRVNFGVRSTSNVVQRVFFCKHVSWVGIEPWRSSSEAEVILSTQPVVIPSTYGVLK
jgi:hypothetical protein